MFIYRDEYYLEQREPKEMAFEGSAEKFHAAMDEWQRDMERCTTGRPDHRQAAAWADGDDRPVASRANSPASPISTPCHCQPMVPDTGGPCGA